jgi:hypothetical protein
MTTTQVPEAPSTKPGVTSKLSEAIARGQQFLAKDEMTPFHAISFTRIFRTQLHTIYGMPSAVDDHWPDILPRIPKEQARELLGVRLAQAEDFLAALNDLPTKTLVGPKEHRVFIGHGRSPIWREVKDFLQDRLELPWEEFNRESVPGIATTARVEQMLAAS